MASQTEWGNIREPLRGPQAALHLNIHPVLHLEYANYELESLAALRAVSIQEGGVQRVARHRADKGRKRGEHRNEGATNPSLFSLVAVTSLLCWARGQEKPVPG